MIRPRKFTPGRKITSVSRFAKLIDQHAWVYYNHKPIHFGWSQNWTFRQVQIAIRAGYLREANPVEVQP